MIQRLPAIALLGIFCGLLGGCGFRSQAIAQLPEAYRTLTLHSPDLYDPLSRAVDSQLRQQGFTVLGPSEHPTLQLQLLDRQEERSLRSLFAEGKAAQYQLIVRVRAQLQWFPVAAPAQLLSQSTESIPLATVVSHTFFDNSGATLAASVEQQLVQQQLCQQAAHQLVLQLITLLAEKRDRPVQPGAAASVINETSAP